MHVSIPQSSSIINKIHAELSGLATAGTLVPDQLYRITDFRTKHLIPNTADYNTGPTEVLIVRAITASELAREAYSESHPQDIIYYELTDSSGAGGDRGRIIRRVDTENNVDVTEDFRHVVYRRWNDGSGNYTELTSKHHFSPYPTASGCVLDSSHIKIIPRGNAQFQFDAETPVSAMLYGYDTTKGRSLAITISGVDTTTEPPAVIFTVSDVLQYVIAIVVDTTDGIDYRDYPMFGSTAKNIRIASLQGYSNNIFRFPVEEFFVDNCHDNSFWNWNGSSIKNVRGQEMYSNIILSEINTLSVNSFHDNLAIGNICNSSFGGETSYIITQGGFDRFVSTNSVWRCHFFDGLTSSTISAYLEEVFFNGQRSESFMAGYLWGHLFNGVSSRSNIVVESGDVGSILPSIYGKTWTNNSSDIEITIDITGVTTLDRTEGNVVFAGIINLISENASENIDLVTIYPTYNLNFDVELRPAASITALTITGTAYASVNADGQILLGAATRVLNGAKRDSIKLRKESITNDNGTFTVVREVEVNISL